MKKALLIIISFVAMKLYGVNHSSKRFESKQHNYKGKENFMFFLRNRGDELRILNKQSIASYLLPAGLQHQLEAIKELNSLFTELEIAANGFIFNS